MEVIRERARNYQGSAPTTGFLSTSSDVLDQPGKTVAGSGEIRYKKHSRSHSNPKYEHRKLRRLRQKVEAYVAQMGVQDFVPPRRVLSLTSGISFNGKPWKKGTGCLFYLDDDARSQRKPRVGQVKRFLALDIDDNEEFFVEIEEHKVIRWQRTVAIVDMSRPTRTRVTHAGHIVSLAAYAKYWVPQFVQYKCVTTVKDTF
jgi:ribosomal protein L35